MTIKLYRRTNAVRAERIDTAGTVFTAGGPVYAGEGDYLEYVANPVEKEGENPGDTTRLLSGFEFERDYEEIPTLEKSPVMDATTSDVILYEPSEHNVVDVLGYLKDPRTDRDEVVRVIVAEEAGKNRAGIVDQVEAIYAEK